MEVIEQDRVYTLGDVASPSRILSSMSRRRCDRRHVEALPTRVHQASGPPDALYSSVVVGPARGLAGMTRTDLDTWTLCFMGNSR